MIRRPISENATVSVRAYAPADDPVDAQILVRNRGLRVWPFDEVGSRQQVLCEIPARNGRTYRLRVSASALQKLDAFDGVRTVQEAIDHCYAEEDDPAARSAFRQFIVGTCIPSGLLVDESAGETAGLSSKSNPSPMLLQRSLLGPEVVGLFARPLEALYRGPIVALAVIAIGIGALGFFLGLGSFKAGTISDLAFSDVCLVLLILGAGLFFHEFGHAAAARRYGCRQTKIGIGLYICFPVFYADLSEGWRLTRRQRIIVDCGGIYFQALFISFLVALNGYVSAPALTYSILALNIALLWNFNPFLRMDGYWIASDLLGVANLRSEAATAARTAWRRMWPGDCAGVDSRGSSLGVYTQVWLCVYWLASACFLVWLANMLIFTTVPALWSDVRLHYMTLIHASGMHSQDVLALTAGKLAWKGLGLALMSYVLYRISRPALGGLVSWLLRVPVRLFQQAAK